MIVFSSPYHGTLRSLAYLNGRAAFEAERPMSDNNPYKAASINAEDFERGWKEAEFAERIAS